MKKCLGVTFVFIVTMLLFSTIAFASDSIPVSSLTEGQILKKGETVNFPEGNFRITLDNQTTFKNVGNTSEVIGQGETFWDSEILKWKIESITENNDITTIELVPYYDLVATNLKVGQILKKETIIKFQGESYFLTNDGITGLNISSELYLPIGTNMSETRFWNENIRIWKVIKITENDGIKKIEIEPAYDILDTELEEGLILEKGKIIKFQGRTFEITLDGVTSIGIRTIANIAVGVNEGDNEFWNENITKWQIESITQVGEKKVIKFIPAYTEKTLLGTEVKDISIKGNFTKDAKLELNKGNLKEIGNNILIKKIGDNKEVIAAYEIKVEVGTYDGKLTLTFDVGEKYNNNIITVYHQKANGEIETFEEKVIDGKISITVNELSPFVLTIEKEEEKEEKEEKKDDTPKTGTQNILIIDAIILVISTISIIMKK